MKLPRRGLFPAVALVVAACAGRGSAGAQHPAPSPMPPGAEWQGLYQGPYHIALNVWRQGNQVVGNWRAIGDREGEFSGTVFGNLLILNFNEQGVKGAERYAGRGYFVYGTGEAGQPDRIYGEWGVGKVGHSTPWWAVKRAPQPQGTSGFVDNSADGDDDELGCEHGGCEDTDTETQ